LYEKKRLTLEQIVKLEEVKTNNKVLIDMLKKNSKVKK